MHCADNGMNSDSVGTIAERFIKNAWDNKRLALAYLFFGPEGTGRLSLARRLAMTVNCQKQSFPPCMVCPSCRRVQSGNHPDVHYIEKGNSSFIRIEQIHQMHKEIFLHPFEGGHKVFIISDSQDFTAEAANALLKILEEPPGDCLVILIASDISRIFSTIISRCQKVRFYAKDKYQTEDILQRDYNIDKDLSHFLAFIFEGGLSQALSFKDGNILSHKNRIISDFIFRPGKPSDSLDIDPKDKENLNFIIKILISCVRDVYLIKTGADKSELINEDISTQLLTLAKRFNYAELDFILSQLCDSRQLLRQNVNPRLLVDNLGLLWKK